MEEETGSLESPSSEGTASALALAQRVRDLGLHLGDILVTGISLGLPNSETGRTVFHKDNMSALMRGDNFIAGLPTALLQAQLDRHVVQVQKGAGGVRQQKRLSLLEDVIQLASRIGDFDPAAEYGLSQSIVDTLDTTYALAVAAGLEVIYRSNALHTPPNIHLSLTWWHAHTCATLTLASHTCRRCVMLA